MGDAPQPPRPHELAKMAASTTTVEEIIREFYVDVKKELNIKAIVDVLYAKRIVYFDLMRDIEREATSNIGNQLFLDHLIKNGTLETLTRFCDVLEETAESELLPHHKYWSEKLKRKLTTVSRHNITLTQSYQCSMSIDTYVGALTISSIVVS